MVCYHLIKITKSNKIGKKMMAVFEDCHTGRQKTTHFGSNISWMSFSFNFVE